ncbi:7-cyano-7-deazaguanine synthase [Bradyrhizobium sp. Ai1a-2]|uniref:7-cyano-7-deazaguanine synthase n=1 Tax=Bradyrhizobium sp. Ai1a-2 TaxID=196490 RepID=UPI000481CDB0|nr:7-cyano-7-deazaguanine synthase [Bradyrhizobium sp. Ai1a-2]
MSVVTLVSGGLDSTLVAYLTRETGVEQHPLFINYGQRSCQRELEACRSSLRRIGLAEPTVADLSGFGHLIRSGLTDTKLRVYEDAFTPGRNMLFLLVAAAHAHQVNADAVAIGLLHESTSLFPDQTSAFLSGAEKMITRCMGKPIKVLAPLASFYKKDVVSLAAQKGIRGTYSCHVGNEEPCGACIACKEFNF